MEEQGKSHLTVVRILNTGRTPYTISGIEMDLSNEVNSSKSRKYIVHWNDETGREYKVSV